MCWRCEVFSPTENDLAVNFCGLESRASRQDRWGYCAMLRSATSGPVALRYPDSDLEGRFSRRTIRRT